MNKLTTIAFSLALASAMPAVAQTSSPTPAPAAAATSGQSLSLTTVHGIYANSITSTGRMHAVSSARIGPRVSGRLAAFANVDGKPLDVGMHVKKGQTLFTLDQTTFQNNLALVNAQLESAKASLANLTAPTREERIEQFVQDIAQLTVRTNDKARERDRYKRLVEEEKTLPPRRLEEVEVDLAGLTAQKKSAEARLLESQHGPTPSEIAVAAARVKEAEAATKISENDLRDTSVEAPFDGMITQRFKSAGEYLVNMPTTDVLEMVSDDNLEAEIAIPESYLPVVMAQSTKLMIKSPLLKQDLPLSITRVVGQVDATRGTFAVRVSIPREQQGLLVSGAFVTAELALSESAGGVIAPSRGVFDQQGKPYVFIARNGKMVRQQVQLGDKLSEGVIISTGLANNEQIVLGPSADMADGKELPDYLK